MSRKDQRAELSDDELKLAMPSLRRRRKAAAPAVNDPPPATGAAATTDDPAADRDDTPLVTAEPEPAPETEPQPEPAAPQITAPQVTAPPVATPRSDEDDPALYATPILSEPEPDPDPEPQPGPEPAAATSPLVAGFEAARARTTTPAVDSEAAAPSDTGPSDTARASAPALASRPSLRDRLGALPLGAVPLPALRGAAAVTVAGLVVGLLLSLATAGTVQACSVSGGRGSCGAPVLAVLVGLFALAVVLGTWLLQRWQVSDAAGTSFIAVGLLATITMLFLIDTLFSWALLLVMPAVSLAAYWVAHLLLTRLDDDTADDDVRR